MFWSRNKSLSVPHISLPARKDTHRHTHTHAHTNTNTHTHNQYTPLLMSYCIFHTRDSDNWDYRSCHSSHVHTVQVYTLLIIRNPAYGIQFLKQMTQILHSRSGLWMNSFGYRDLFVLDSECVCDCVVWWLCLCWMVSVCVCVGWWVFVFVLDGECVCVWISQD